MADRFATAMRQQSLLDDMLRVPHEGEPEFAIGTLLDAMPLVLNHHYARRRTADPMFVFLWRYGNDVVATAVFTSPANRFFGVGAIELSRLVRLPEFSAFPLSRFVSKCLRWLRRNTALAYCLSYAETAAGHVGFIYQACNFRFVNTSPGHAQWRHERTGKVVSNRSFDQQTDRTGWAKVKTGRKFLYVYPLNEPIDRILERFSWSILPYPKAVTA